MSIIRIHELSVYAVHLPMKQQFSISGGVVGDVQQGAPHVYVKITGDDGLYGWGEARPSHRWSYETLESVVSTIDQYLKPVLIGENASDLETIHQKMNSQIAAGGSVGQPIAKAAVDMALHDLLGKHAKKSLGELWLGPCKDSISLSYLISTNNPVDAARKARYAKEKGYKGVDVKIGLNPIQDTEILEAVKAEAPDLFFRVDANQKYTFSQALQLTKEMERIGVDVFEQPLPANQLLDHAALRKRTHMPIALDESIWSPSDLIQALRLEACDTVVIKVTKMGGLREAKLCGEIARAARLNLLGGGLTESTLGLTASAHLFHYLQIDTPVDLNGPFFLADDPISAGPSILESDVTLPRAYGIGCELSEEKLKTLGESLDHGT